ncbi:MAG: Holliday junction branch migration protein RuvA [Flavobacteriales bacterium]|nr:Holliday junction branch migration protein RuvA [Flavobacteriales bacterium]
MIDSLRGELLERSPDHVVVECGGVGYLAYITPDTFTRLPAKGPCRFWVHYTVSVDVRSGQSEHKLFGFLDTVERHLFRQLITVAGVSTTIGLAIVGTRSADDLRSAIMSGDERVLKGAKGVGPKLAQRIVQELSGKLAIDPLEKRLATAPGGSNTLKAEALSALISLGSDRMKAERALQRVLEERKDEPPGVEELIRLVLKSN